MNAMTRAHRLGPSLFVAALLLAGSAALLPSAAGASGMTGAVDGKTLDHVALADQSIDRSTITHAKLTDVSVQGSTLSNVGVQGGSLSASDVSSAGIDGARLQDVRLTHVGATHVTLGDSVTACSAHVNRFGYGPCALIDAGGVPQAWIQQDAPAKLTPNQTFDLRVYLRNPASSLGFSARTTWLPFASATLNASDVFDVTASGAVQRIDVLRGGDVVGTGNTSQRASFDHPVQGALTLRVHVAANVVDTSVLALQLDTGHGKLTFASAAVNVVATSLAFLPVDQQPFGPYVADAVGRLVAVQPLDALGNVDRHIDVAMHREVVGFAAPGDGWDASRSAALHGDSEFFSSLPAMYKQPSNAAAHHPAVLEFIVRNINHVMVPFGALPAHMTHLVVMGPYATDIDLTASAVNDQGATLTTPTLHLHLPATPAAPPSVSNAFGNFTFPGQGHVAGSITGASGGTMVLAVTETPNSHNTTVTHTVPAASSYGLLLPSTTEHAGLPFGNFIPNTYLISCLHHGQRAEANGGESVTVPAGSTATENIAFG